MPEKVDISMLRISEEAYPDDRNHTSPKELVRFCAFTRCFEIGDTQR
jgi:hypothetical protein